MCMFLAKSETESPKQTQHLTLRASISSIYVIAASVMELRPPRPNTNGSRRVTWHRQPVFGVRGTN